MWHCLGVQVDLCPPHRPDRNGWVERYTKSYKYACLLIARPTDAGQVREVTAVYHHHYTHERPNQAKPCGNHPPRVAFPTEPSRPPLPASLDPDGWVQASDGEYYARKVRGDGCVSLGERSYDVQQTKAWQAGRAGGGWTGERTGRLVSAGSDQADADQGITAGAAPLGGVCCPTPRGDPY